MIHNTAKVLIIVLLIFYLCLNIYANNLKYTNGENLGILIMGTITNNDNPYQNVALLKDLKTNKIYAVKKDYIVLNDLKILDISSKYIVIANTKESYLIYQNKFASEFTKYTKPQKDTSLLDMPISSNFEGSYKEEGFERIKNKITITSQYKENVILKNLPNILMQASSLPVVENGKIIGFKILNIDPSSIFIKAGFQNDDIITSINGKSLNDAASAIKILQSLKNESQITVNIIRNNQELQLYINVN